MPKSRTGPPHEHTRDTPETTQAERSASVFPVEKIRTALVAYRIMAWITGIWLIALCGEVVSHLVVPPRDPVD